jgi:hypothetical protein
VVDFCLVWGWGTLDTQLARWKLGENTHPNHGGRHRLTAAMVPPPALPHTTISQHAARQVYVVKTREYYCFTIYYSSYFKVRYIVNTPCLCVCGLCQQAALRVSYSQWAALSVSYSQLVALIVSYFQPAALKVCCSECTESIIFLVQPNESMILSAPFDCVIML